ncbi:hypothetical protein [Shouchella clausii]|uniref:hypothetical protein n=1 Tax=Shouchella clausii TaxID=79880 RepID=UPI0026FD34A8|nr:hypothetical protein [Shouchella clausii]MDO7269993.1 hypothetical protein [Shouchella clausii]MDO7286938.1 hypothetical protein [Shouchella clausii]
MLKNSLIACGILLFLSGFFFLDKGEANPYKEETTTIDQKTFMEVKLAHEAAKYVLENHEQQWYSHHFTRTLSEEEQAAFLAISLEKEAEVAEEGEEQVALSYNGTVVSYEKVDNVWKIAQVEEAHRQWNNNHLYQ